MQLRSVNYTGLQQILTRVVACTEHPFPRNFNSSYGSNTSIRNLNRGISCSCIGGIIGQGQFIIKRLGGGFSSIRYNSSRATVRSVRRFTVCDDASEAASKQQSFWWSDDYPDFIIGIDCSVRSTGYCVLKSLSPSPQCLDSSAFGPRLSGCEAALPCVVACGSISTGNGQKGVISTIDPAHFLTDMRACLIQVKRDVERDWGGGKWLVIVEDCLMQYQGRRSSAETIVNLARFNALISGVYPSHIAAASAAHGFVSSSC
jgi:hypothetical protein